MQLPSDLFDRLSWESLSVSEQLSKSQSYTAAYRFMYSKLDSSPNEQLVRLIKSAFEWNAICMVYFSNHIEKVGLSSEETYTICTEHLEISPPVSPGDDDVMSKSCPSPGSISSKDKHKDRKEIVQHMDAFLYLHDRIIRQKRSLDERLIMNAHKIKMFGILENAGSYRSSPAYAGNHQFLPADLVPRSMSTLISNYNKHVNLHNGMATEQQQRFYLASKLSYEFVTIHPFVDGNGRLCRLLLNIALLQ